jgi:hypothetical protein
VVVIVSSVIPNLVEAATQLGGLLQHAPPITVPPLLRQVFPQVILVLPEVSSRMEQPAACGVPLQS